MPINSRSISSRPCAAAGGTFIPIARSAKAGAALNRQCVGDHARIAAALGFAPRRPEKLGGHIAYASTCKPCDLDRLAIVQHARNWPTHDCCANEHVINKAPEREQVPHRRGMVAVVHVDEGASVPQWDRPHDELCICWRSKWQCGFECSASIEMRCAQLQSALGVVHARESIGTVQRNIHHGAACNPALHELDEAHCRPFPGFAVRPLAFALLLVDRFFSMAVPCGCYLRQGYRQRAHAQGEPVPCGQ